MYKVLEYYGNRQEFETWLNNLVITQHMTLSHVVCSDENHWIVVMWDPDIAKQKQMLVDYAKANLSIDCLTCRSFGYYCRGCKSKCEAWEYDEHAYKRIDHVV